MEKINNWLDSVYSDGSCNFVSNPLPKKGETISIKIRFKENSPVTSVFFRTKQNGIEVLKKMNFVELKNGLAYYSVDIQVWEDELHYQFYLVADERIYYYTEKEITTYIPEETSSSVKWTCGICGYEYDGTAPFEELPDSYVCPICRQAKDKFKTK